MCQLRPPNHPFSVQLHNRVLVESCSLCELHICRVFRLPAAAHSIGRHQQQQLGHHECRPACVAVCAAACPPRVQAAASNALMSRPMARNWQFALGPYTLTDPCAGASPSIQTMAMNCSFETVSCAQDLHTTLQPTAHVASSRKR